MIQTISHLNYISGNINDVAQSNSPTMSEEVYCKKLHKICVPEMDDCANCAYFGGFMQGYGHECIWEDVIPAEYDEWQVAPDEVQKELLRVSKLIDRGLIQKG